MAFAAAVWSLQHDEEKPNRRPPSINDHFRREWMVPFALMIILIVMTFLAAAFAPMLLGL